MGPLAGAKPGTLHPPIDLKKSKRNKRRRIPNVNKEK
jgi:hypothetical protein